MPGKSSPKKRRQYAPEQMALAIEAVRENKMSKKQASKIFGVPRTTLLDKLSGRVPEGPVSPGTRPTLTEAEEKTLVNYILLMADVGYPLTRKELLLEVKKILDLDGRKTAFRDNLPGKDWYKRFRQRNPELTMRTPQSLGHERAMINKDMVEMWFSTLFKFLDSEVPDYKMLINNPRRIFNADESGFPLCIKSGKVLAGVGSKHVYQVVTNNKTQITVMACFNALGDYLPPLIVYPGQRLRDVGLSSFTEAIFGQTENGWMDADLFVAFLEHFLHFVKSKSIPFPVILFVDGHATHMTLAASEFCSKNGIILYCLLPNATHILQACDIGLFSPMKSAWISEVKYWQMNHIGEVLTKKTFPEVFKIVWDRVTTLENSTQGFKKSGLYPLTPEGIDLTKLGPSKLVQNVPCKTKTEETVTASPVSSSWSNVTMTIQAEVHNHADNGTELDACRSNTVENFTSNEADIQSDKHAVNNHSSTITNAFNTVPLSENSRHSNNNVSPAFESVLTIPELPCKKINNNIRNKLPKALSGTEALKMLREREKQKQDAEVQKQKRKEERVQKRKEKEEEKEKKRVEKEKRRAEKEQKNKEKELMKNKKVKKRTKSSAFSDSDTEEENVAIPYMDSSDTVEENGSEGSIDEELCAICFSNETKGDDYLWVGCDSCERWFHSKCTNDENLISIQLCDISKYKYVCSFCQ